MTRRFSSITNQIDSILTSFRASIFKDCCPVLGYCAAAFRSTQLCIECSRMFGGSGSRGNVNYSFAPVYLGRLGFPHLRSFLSSDCVDSLTTYTSVMTSLSDVTFSPSGKQEIGRLLHAPLQQAPRTVSPWALLLTFILFLQMEFQTHQEHYKALPLL